MKPPAFNPPSHVDLETAARLAGVTRRTVQNKLSAGEIPRKAVKMDGRQKLVAVSALEAVFGPLRVSPSKGEVPGTVHGSFQESPSEVAELRAQLAAKETIIATLQASLDHERQDRAHERENWRKTLERTQASLLAAQDTPTARALAGAKRETDVVITTGPVPTKPPAKPKPKRAKKPGARPWWLPF